MALLAWCECCGFACVLINTWMCECCGFACVLINTWMWECCDFACVLINTWMWECRFNDIHTGFTMRLVGSFRTDLSFLCE